MPRSNTFTLAAAVALLLVTAGCSFDDLDPHAGMMPAASTQIEPAAGHEAWRMFEAEKRNAPLGELPVQF